MADLVSLDFLRILVPDIAAFWKVLFDGLWALKVPALMYTLGYVFLALGFAFTIYEILLHQSLQPLTSKALRLLVASVAIGYYPTLLGATPGFTTPAPAPNTGAAWKSFHAIYSAIYVGPNSFYSTWVANPNPNSPGPIPQAMKKLVEAYQSLIAKKTLVMTLDFGITQLLSSFFPGVTAVCSMEKLIPMVKSTPVLGTLANALCYAKDKVEQSIKALDNLFSKAENMMIASITIPIAAHALIIYSTLAIFTAVIFTLPLTAGLFLFRGTEKILLTSVALYFASFLALGVSAVGFAATAYVLYNSLASIWSTWANRISEDLKQKTYEAEKTVKVLQGHLNVLRPHRDQLANEIEAINNIRANIQQYIDANGVFTRQAWPSPYTDPATGDIAYPLILYDPNTGQITVRRTTCPGTSSRSSQPFDPVNLDACVTNMNSALAQVDGHIQGLAETVSKSYNSLMDQLIAKMVRFRISLTLMASAAGILSFVLTSAMILLVTRIVGVVQGFNLGRGMGGIGLPR